jgi:hypothetical protein
MIPARRRSLEAGHRRFLRQREDRLGKLDYDQLEGRYDIEIGAGANKVTVRT